jgi:Uma2 family endonuclease
MSTVLQRRPKTRRRELNLAELLDRFGPMPAGRIRTDPAPGTAKVKDVLAIHDREKRLCELVDAVLLEKVIGYEESVLAIEIASLLKDFIRPKKLGIVAGEAGMLRLAPELVRIPDVSFIARSRLPQGKLPRGPIPALAPNLAVEVLSQGNTDQEMSRKLDDYFDAGVQLVWFVDPPTRSIEVFTSRANSLVVKGAQTLTGGTVLPGFKVKVAKIFAALDEWR